MKFYSVFVGINEYQDQRISPLRFAIHDAQQFYERAIEYWANDEQETWLLTDQEATKKRVTSLIGTELASQVQEDDMVLFYFSGHGSPETTGEIDNISRYLIMYDTDYKDIFTTAIDLERELDRLLKRLKSKWIVGFIDSCFSGRVGGRTFEGPKLMDIDMRGKGRDLLQKLEFGEGRILMTACDDNEIAFESSKLGHGVFTFQLLRLLTDRRFLRPTIGIGELYDQVTRMVKEFTSGEQHPILHGRARGVQVPLLLPNRHKHSTESS